MAEFVILQNPIVLVLCGAALVLCLFDRIKCISRGWLTVLSAVLALIAVGMDLLGGADLREAAAILMIFLLLFMGVRK